MYTDIKSPTVDPFDSAVAPVARQRWLVALIGLIAIAVVVIEYKLFKEYFRTFIGAYYPFADDQIGTFLAAYKIHYAIVTNGVACLFTDPSLLNQCVPMKGVAVPLLGALSTFFGGTSRLAVVSVNFCFFVGAQLAIGAFCKRWFGWANAVIALGLFLCSFTIYFAFGGLSDMRLDFAGMIVAGAAFMSVCVALRSGCKVAYAGVAVALVVCEMTRSILLFYWMGALALIAFSVAVVPLLNCRYDWVKAMRSRSLVLCGVSLGILVVHFGVFWKEFGSYYVLGKTSNEAAMRLREFGLKDKLDIFSFYLNSFREHFTLPVFLAVVVSAVGSLASRIAGATMERVRSNEILIICLVFACFAISVFGCVTFYHPTPVPIGVLCIPLCITLACCIQGFLRQKVVLSVCAIVVMMVGASTYARQMKDPISRPHPVPLESLCVDILQARVIEAIELGKEKPCWIYFCLPHGGLNMLVTQIKWYEIKKREFPKGIKGALIPAFPPVEKKTVLATVDLADIVVAPTKMPPSPADGAFEYSGIAATRDALPEIHRVLAAEFRLVQELPINAPGWRVGVFVRRSPR